MLNVIYIQSQNMHNKNNVTDKHEMPAMPMPMTLSSNREKRFPLFYYHFDPGPQPFGPKIELIPYHYLEQTNNPIRSSHIRMLKYIIYFSRYSASKIILHTKHTFHLPPIWLGGPHLVYHTCFVDDG